MALNKIINIGLIFSLVALLLNIVLILADFKSIGKFPTGLAVTTSFLFLLKVRRARQAKQSPLV